MKGLLENRVKTTKVISMETPEKPSEKSLLKKKLDEYASKMNWKQKTQGLGSFRNQFQIKHG